MRGYLGAEFRCTASPRRASGRPTRIYELVIEVTANEQIKVKEYGAHPLLPSFCPQRHMNPDGSFCLGFNAGKTIVDADRATSWWKKLEVFLTCQDTAHESRSWPPKIEISHGSAGETEIKAENVAEELGLLTDYQSAVRDDEGLIAESVRRIRKSTGRLPNGRAPCVCNRRYKTGELYLRRACWAAAWPCLVNLEAQRRREERTFWKTLKEQKQACCRTMDDCPLKQ